MPHALLADLVLALHLGVVAFVVGGLVAIVLGGLRGWPWSADPRFRLAHAAAIGFVVAEAWIGLACPLTTLEMALRRRAGGTAYAGGFVEHWLQRLLYWDAPAWAFTLAYTLFGLLVVLAGWRFPPRRRRPGPRRAG